MLNSHLFQPSHCQTCTGHQTIPSIQHFCQWFNWSREPMHWQLVTSFSEILHLHHRLGHKGFHNLQKWAAEGINGIPSDVTMCLIPMCCACQYGVTKKCSHETNNTGSVVGAPKGPGNLVSMDQMIAGSPGLIPFDSGHPSAQWYKSVTMWVDHFSRYLHANCHEQATIQSALESKKVLSCSPNAIMYWSSTFTVIMVCSQQMLSKTMSLPVINSNHFVALVHTGRTVSLSIISASSQPVPAPCSCMQCRCGQTLLLQSSGAMLFCTQFAYTTANHCQTKQSLLSLSSPMKIWITHPMISECLDHQLTFLTQLYSQALSIQENGKRDPTRVYTLDIRCIMQAM